MTTSISFSTLLSIVEHTSIGTIYPIFTGEESVYAIIDCVYNVAILYIKDDRIVVEKSRVIRGERVASYGKESFEHHIPAGRWSEHLLISIARRAKFNIYVLSETHLENFINSGNFYGTSLTSAYKHMLSPSYWMDLWKTDLSKAFYTRIDTDGSPVTLRKMPGDEIWLSKRVINPVTRELESQSSLSFTLPRRAWDDFDPVIFDLANLRALQGTVVEEKNEKVLTNTGDEHIVEIEKPMDGRNEIAGIPYAYVVQQAVVTRGNQILEAVAGVRGDGLVDIYLTKNKQLFAIVSQSLMREYLNKAIEYAS